MIQNYRDLEVWQLAMQLAKDIFILTESFPVSQRYVMITQLQRSALSVPSNIAEGRSRHSKNDFIYHLNIARGSLAELETQLLLSHQLGYVAEIDALMDSTNRITRMLHGLKNSLMQEPILKAVTQNP